MDGKQEEYSFDISATLSKWRSKVPVKSILSAIMVIFVTIISFGTVETSSAGWIELTGMAVLLYITSIMLYQSSYTSAVTRAKEGQTWIDANNRHDVIVGRLRQAGAITMIEKWCSFKREQIRTEYVKSKLRGTPVSYEDFLAEYAGLGRREIFRIQYHQGKKLDRRSRVQLMQAATCGEPRLTADILLHRCDGYDNPFEPIGVSPEVRQKRDVRLALFTRLVTTFTAGYLTVDFVGDASWAAFGLWLMRMLPLVFAAVSGMMGGTDNINRHGVSFRERQCAYLQDYEVYVTECRGDEEGDAEKNEKIMEDVRLSQAGDRSDSGSWQLHEGAGDAVQPSVCGQP